MVIIKVRFLGRSYDLILNEYLRRKNLPEKILDFLITIYEICDFKICMGGTYMYISDLIYKFKQNNFDRKIFQKNWSYLRQAGLPEKKARVLLPQRGVVVNTFGRFFYFFILMLDKDVFQWYRHFFDWLLKCNFQIAFIVCSSLITIYNE